MTADLIASVAAEDRRVSIQDLDRAHGTSYGTISRILHSQLGLVKKSARCMGPEAVVHTAKVVQEFLAKKGSNCSTPPIHLTSPQPTTSSSPS
jgi:hypothetical protein